MDKVVRTERGWGGHFICADRCQFRRNTLLEYKDTKIVVSTVGQMLDLHNFKETVYETVGDRRYYETMVFHAKYEAPYWEADVTRLVEFDSPWYIEEMGDDLGANNMHEQVVDEIIKKIRKGVIE